MNRDEQLNITSIPIAEEAHPPHEDVRRESVPDHDVDPNVKNSDLPKGLDKPDSELVSLNDDLQRVEKRTTM